MTVDEEWDEQEEGSLNGYEELYSYKYETARRGRPCRIRGGERVM